jgi:hypothetical protein
METLIVILGLGVFYTWVHAVVLIFKGGSWEDKTDYQKVIMVLAVLFLVLHMVG